MKYLMDKQRGEGLMSVRLLHITDSHLYSDTATLLKGICSHDSFAAVLADAYQRFPEIHALILGGDMAQDEQPGTYRMIADMLPDWQAPVMLSPGNHASLEHISTALIPALKARAGGFFDHAHAGNWQMITLNSHQQGKVPGFLSGAELARLERLLSASHNLHTLIAVHHPVLPIGCKWLDKIGLQNSDALWAVVHRHPQVRVLLCGHVHQAFDTMHDGVRVLCSPSSSVQFTPRVDTFEVQAISPGYRWLELLEDGTLHTGIHRIQGFIPTLLHDVENY